MPGIKKVLDSVAQPSKDKMYSRKGPRNMCFRHNIRMGYENVQGELVVSV